jgi:acyl carrier protein
MTSTISRDQLLTKIKTVLVDRFGLDLARLDEQSKLRDLGVDSMHVVEIMLDLEDDLGIKLEGLSMPPNPSLANVVDTLADSLSVRTTSDVKDA